MSASKVVLHVKDEALRRETVATLSDACPGIGVDQRDLSWSELIDEVGQTRPDAVLLDVDGLPTDTSAAIKQLKAQHPRLKVIALHGSRSQNHSGGHACRSQ